MDSSGETARPRSGHAEPRSGHAEPRSGPGRTDLRGLYHLGRTLGRGHFAVVKLARHVNTGDLVAVKMIDKTKLDVMATSHLLQEVRCMRLVQHPNVVRLYEVIDTPTTLYLVMELAEGGDLFDYIIRHEGGVAEDTAKRHFAQIVRAVAYCHRLHVVHRDLKPENVVFFPQQGVVKLTDFGFSNLFQPGTMLATSCGSLAYSAPEILLGEEYDAPAVDIWSLGVILYMLVCGVPPFQETNDSETLVMILDCRYRVPDHVSDHCKDLITRMLRKDPAHRASLEAIEAHHWLQGLDDALLSPEAPPHWFSGALSPSSPRAGLPECGDLLAARPSAQQTFPRQCQPTLSFTLHPPAAEELPVNKNLPGLQQICEEEEEEEEGEEEEEEEEDAIQTHNIPPSKVAGSGVRCCQGSSTTVDPEERTDKQMEPNNNIQDPAPVLPEPPAPSILETSVKGAPRTEAEADQDGTSEGGGDDPRPTNRPHSHNAPGSRNEAALKAEHGKRHSVKLRDRLFQFPLCEKALAFNTPTHKKPKILPLAQYNCCRVL
ncbi:SNF related kinase b isoform X2 [Takifugu rubripes]|uniref:SNF related kinase b isoform X2 n=1 Tax=Takifugu rubripes TaxID=31033 RepID=UPI001145E036|nr:serine/threonine-protein kinase SRK2H-like isoform X2 [Takifugu rubripes]